MQPYYDAKMKDFPPTQAIARGAEDISCLIRPSNASCRPLGA